MLTNDLANTRSSLVVRFAAAAAAVGLLAAAAPPPHAGRLEASPGIERESPPSRSSMARAAAGLVEVASAHDVKETVARLEGAFARANVTVVARIDHAAAAAKVGEQLPPTVLLVFGNPKLGTPLMRCAPSAGIDLPLKALVRDDGTGRVTLTYSDPGWIAARHGAKGCDEVVNKMSGALRSFAEAATAR